ncbi:MAG: hypothetical protein ACI8W7_002694 [Gammaproteobacteria bacterium]|jgi:hypothetical protein
MRDQEQYQTAKRLHEVEAENRYLLDVFGDHLADREGYRAIAGGFEAVRYYLMQKHSWTPYELRNMSALELRFALVEEMHGWTPPEESRSTETTLTWPQNDTDC